MLGTYGTSAYKNIEDFISHKDYLKYMYGNIGGFVARGAIPKDDSKGGYYETYNKFDRLLNRNSYFGCENVYTSMNSFLSPRNPSDENSGRKVKNLKRLNALYIDIDCYKLDLSQEQVIAALQAEYFGQSIPVPTFIINSGRGLYLIWKLRGNKDGEDRNALPLWTSIEEYLLEQCKDFNADPSATDAARILRVPFSINSKNGSTVSIISFTDVSYSLYELKKEYDVKPIVKYPKKNPESHPYGEATERQRQYAAVIATQQGLELPDFTSYETTFEFISKYGFSRKEGAGEQPTNILSFTAARHTSELLNGRCKDIERLFSMRKGADCSREYGLFLYRLWVCERTKDYELAIRMTLELNARLDVPFTEQFVLKRTESAEKKVKSDSTYNYSLKKIIEVLNITDEEMKSLSYLCTYPQSAKERKSINNRKAYLEHLNQEGKEIKTDTIKTRREAIAALVSEGKTKENICEALHISARTYDRDKAVCVSDGLIGRAIKALGEIIEDIRDVANTAVETVETAVTNATENIIEVVETIANAAESVIADVRQKLSPIIIDERRSRSARFFCSEQVQFSFVQLSLFTDFEAFCVNSS